MAAEVARLAPLSPAFDDRADEGGLAAALVKPHRSAHELFAVQSR